MRTRSILRDVEASYKANNCDCSECTAIAEAFTAIDLNPYTRLIEKIAKDMHEGSLKPEDLNVDLVKQIFKDLSSGAQTVYHGDDWVEFNVKEPNSLIQKFKKNLWQFSAAKTYGELQEMNNLLLDGGKIRKFPDFLQEVRKTNIKFNENYLQAEHQTAIKGSQTAEQWKGFLKNADLFPNLEYRTIGDNRVRPEHQMLNGVIKPIGDGFWRTYYPPNGWRCRCYVVQTAAKATPGQIDDDSVLPEFRGNTALDEEIFTKKGGFFKLLNMDHKAKVNAEYMKLNAPYDLAYKAKNGKKVYANIFADESDKVKNIETAMIIVEKLDKDVYVRPHIDVQNHKNPEYQIDGKLADRKEQRGKNIASNLASAKKQGCKTVVFDITDDYPYSLERFKTNLAGNIAHYTSFEKVIIIKGNHAEEIKVKDLVKNIKPKPAKKEPVKPEPAKPAPVKKEPEKPTPAKPEPAKPEPAKPAPPKVKKPKDPEFTPKKISTYEKKNGVTINRDIFNYLRKEITVTIQSKKHPYYSRALGHIVLSTDYRYRKSWMGENVIYHEFGHAIDHHHGIREMSEITDLMKKYRDKMGANDNKIYKEIEEKWREQAKNAKRGEHDKIESFADTIMALNSDFGRGHTKSYFEEKGMPEAEFIAHCFENYYGNNDKFKEIYPELHDDMVEALGAVFKKIKK